MPNFFGKEFTQEEYDAIIEDMKKYFQQIAEYENRQLSRITKFIEKLSQEELEKWIDKFLKWEDDYEEFQYVHRHVQTESKIFAAWMSYIEQQGKSMRIFRNEMFCTRKYKWKKYKFVLYQGQGAFWRIWKGRKVIFQNR